MNEAAIVAVLESWKAVDHARPSLRGVLTAPSGGVHYNLAVALDELQRLYEEQNRAAVAAAELPGALAALGWTLDTSGRRKGFHASKAVDGPGADHVSRTAETASALLEAVRAYEEQAA